MFSKKLKRTYDFNGIKLVDCSEHGYGKITESWKEEKDILTRISNVIGKKGNEFVYGTQKERIGLGVRCGFFDSCISWTDTKTDSFEKAKSWLYLKPELTK